MRVLDGSWRTWPPATERSSVTIGVLDGVHRGHRALLAQLDDTMSATVLTFDPHPVEVLRPGTAPRLITNIGERIGLLKEAGIDCAGILDLAEIKDLTPEEFVDGVLVDKLRIGHLVVGEDFRFGRDRSGDVETLAKLGDELGFLMDTIALVTDDGSPVSSSRIRGLIEAGQVSEAATLLGSRFTLTNEVIHGDKRGRDIGFPTANLRPPGRKVIPATGVYSCFATVEGHSHLAAVNVGFRPTFGGDELLIEAFILDFDDEIYGKDLTLEFVEYTRPELKFPGVEELVSQMKEDVAQSRAVLDEAR